MARKPIIAGNWKMNLLQADAKALFEGISCFVKDFSAQQLPTVVVAPVFTSLSVVNAVKCDCGCGENKINVAAQNCHWEKSGAYTGELSVEMLADAGCSYIIIGHSERRQYFSETDEMINKKAKAILAGGLIPIICCGETLEQREAGVTDEHIATQIRAALNGLSEEEISKSVIAYEPIWAIGTGKTATAEMADETCGFIRGVVAELYNNETAEAIRIQYGGSVKVNNIEELMNMPNIDGALIGGASLIAEDFIFFANTAAKLQ